MNILAVTVPIYIVMAIGYLAGRAGAFSAADMRVLGKFVVKFALPALLFTALSQRPIADIVDGSYLAAYAMGSLVVFAATGAFARSVGSPQHLAQRPRRSPIVISEPLLRTVNMLAMASTALALFVIGGSPVGLDVRNVLGPVTGVALAKLLLHPLVVFALLWLLPRTDPKLQIGAVIFASMPMLSIFRFLRSVITLKVSVPPRSSLRRCCRSFVSVTAVLWMMATWLSGTGFL